jgi:hypothetical protein
MLVIAGCVQSGAPAERGNEQSQLEVNAIALKLSKDEIGRIEIFQIPNGVLTDIRISPEMLEKQFHYKFTIRDVRQTKYKDKLEEAVKSTTVQPGAEIPDIRWGAVFYGLEDDRVGAFYFDKTGARGAVGKTPVSFNGGFFKWMEGSFAAVFN